MERDIWFRDDVRHVLLAVDEANASLATFVWEVGSDPGLLRAYRAGFRAALVATALAFGIADAGSRRPGEAALPEAVLQQWTETRALRRRLEVEAP